MTWFGRELLIEFLKTNVLGGVLLFPVISCLETIFQVQRRGKLGGDSLWAAALSVLYFLLLYGTLYCLLIAIVKHLAARDTGGVPGPHLQAKLG